MTAQVNRGIVLLVVLGLISACSQRQEEKKAAAQTSGKAITGASQHCLNNHDLTKYKNSAKTNSVLWILVRHYSLCLNDEKMTEPLLRELAARGDPEAMVQLAAWLNLVGKRDEALRYATKAKDMGYRSGDSELKSLQSEQ